mmetsp:Transcript_7063/g.29142  ORF Transcript_7063/g.29142 Transcript_7063/m.29142 type:complete len:279 (+) Transcript_7063:535-1371(+)
MSTSNASPVAPLIMVSEPWYAYPCFRKTSPCSSIGGEKASPSRALWNGDASTNRPSIAPALLAIDSTNMPMVMRLGNACGLMRMSGRTPVRSQYGRSSSGHRNDSTPFWPCRDENLSPMIGLRLKRIVTDILVSFFPRAPGACMSATRSTTAPSAPFTLVRRARPVALFSTDAIALPGSIREPGRGAPSTSTAASGAFFSGAPAAEPRRPRPTDAGSARFPNTSPSAAALAETETVSVLYNVACASPRSIEPLFTIIASSMSYPVYASTATTALVPSG